MKIEITDAAVTAVAQMRLQTLHTTPVDFGRDSIRRDLAAALPHLKVTGEHKYRVQLTTALLHGGKPVNVVQREGGGWTDVCYCTSLDEAEHIMRVLVISERGEA